jgi:hypothetical protein
LTTSTGNVREGEGGENKQYSCPPRRHLQLGCGMKRSNVRNESNGGNSAETGSHVAHIIGCRVVALFCTALFFALSSGTKLLKLRIIVGREKLHRSRLDEFFDMFAIKINILAG